jgi:hypothetical protein
MKKVLMVFIALWGGLGSAQRCDGVSKDQVPTIATVLAASCISFGKSPPVDTNLPITSYWQLNEKDEYIIAYYFHSLAEPASLESPLRVLRYEKTSGKWSEKSLSEVGFKSADLSGSCLGPVWGDPSLVESLLVEYEPHSISGVRHRTESRVVLGKSLLWVVGFELRLGLRLSTKHYTFCADSSAPYLFCRYIDFFGDTSLPKREP